MQRQVSPTVFAARWESRLPGQIQRDVTVAEALSDARFELEGNELVAVEAGHTDTEDTTMLHVPAIGLVVAGDVAYNDVLLYLAVSDHDKRMEWLRALDIIEGKTKSSPVGVFQQALDNVMPSIEVRSRRVGGATYQVPVEVRTSRRQALGIRWLISAARDRNEKTMTERLSAELLDASNSRGNAVKKREDTHKMAEANRAFSPYRW